MAGCFTRKNKYPLTVYGFDFAHSVHDAYAKNKAANRKGLSDAFRKYVEEIEADKVRNLPPKAVEHQKKKKPVSLPEILPQRTIREVKLNPTSEGSFRVFPRLGAHMATPPSAYTSGYMEAEAEAEVRAKIATMPRKIVNNCPDGIARGAYPGLLASVRAESELKTFYNHPPYLDNLPPDSNNINRPNLTVKAKGGGRRPTTAQQAATPKPAEEPAKAQLEELY